LIQRYVWFLTSFLEEIAEASPGSASQLGRILAGASPAGSSYSRFSARMGFVALMMEFPRPVLWAHRLFFAGAILYMAPSIWRMFSQPVTMLSDYPATVFASTLILAGFVFCWLPERARWLLLLCDGLLILIAARYFFGR
jgi:hypothetical protein